MTDPAQSTESAPPFATWADFEVMLKTSFDEAERAQVGAIIKAVYAYIKVKRPMVEVAVDAGRLDRDIIVAVIVQVGSRMLQAAERNGIKSEQYPEWTVTLTEAAQRGLFLTDDELAVLAAGAAPTVQAAAYSVQLYR